MPFKISSLVESYMWLIIHSRQNMFRITSLIILIQRPNHRVIEIYARWVSNEQIILDNRDITVTSYQPH